MSPTRGDTKGGYPVEIEVEGLESSGSRVVFGHQLVKFKYDRNYSVLQFKCPSSTAKRVEICFSNNPGRRALFTFDDYLDYVTLHEVSTGY